jgi:hypothetical protein
VPATTKAARTANVFRGIAPRLSLALVVACGVLVLTAILPGEQAGKAVKRHEKLIGDDRRQHPPGAYSICVRDNHRLPWDHKRGRRRVPAERIPGIPRAYLVQEPERRAVYHACLKER